MKYSLASDGKNYAVKKSYLFFESEYLDFKYLDKLEEQYWWPKDFKAYPNCWTSDKELAETWLKRFMA